MSAVRDLAPGDVVDGPGGLFSATFIAATAHPLFGGLKLVVWQMSDGTVSLDALSPFQHVGDVRRSDAGLREAALRRALTPGVAGQEGEKR